MFVQTQRHFDIRVQEAAIWLQLTRQAVLQTCRTCNYCMVGKTAVFVGMRLAMHPSPAVTHSELVLLLTWYYWHIMLPGIILLMAGLAHACLHAQLPIFRMCHDAFPDAVTKQELSGSTDVNSPVIHEE